MTKFVCPLCKDKVDDSAAATALHLFLHHKDEILTTMVTVMEKLNQTTVVFDDGAGRDGSTEKT